ncbi:MAG: hypothetical protein WC714_04840 [Candidatus Obscuribacterales bacterium]
MSIWDDINTEPASVLASAGRTPGYGNSQASIWDDLQAEDEANRPIPQPPQRQWHQPIGEAVNNAATLVGGISNNLDRAGLDTSEFFNHAREARKQQYALPSDQRFAPRALAATSGAIGLTDMVGNFVAAPVQQYLGVDPEDRFVFDNKKRFNELPAISSVRDLAPEFYDQYADVAQNVAPLPGRSAELLGQLGKRLPAMSPAGEAILELAKRMGGTKGARLIDAAMTQGLIGGGQAINEAAKARQDINPMQIALSAGLGAAGGAGLMGLEELIGGIAKPLQQRLSGLRRGSDVAMPNVPQTNNNAVDLGSRIESMINRGHVDAGDPELAGLQQILDYGKAQAPNVPTQAAPAGIAPPARVQASPMDLAPPRKALKGSAQVADLFMDLAPIKASTQPTKPTADVLFHNRLQAIREAQPDTIMEAVSQAARSIPRGAPPEMRKTLTDKIRSLVTDTLKRHKAEAQELADQASKAALAANDGGYRYPENIQDFDSKMPQDGGYRYPGNIEEFDNPIPRDGGLRYPDTIDYAQAEGPHGLKYPDYLDYDQAPKASNDEYIGSVWDDLEAESQAANPPARSQWDDLVAELEAPNIESEGRTRDLKITDEAGKHVLGRDVVQYAKPIDEIKSEPLRGAVEEVAKAKLAHSEAEYTFDAYGEKLYEKFGNGKDALQIGKYTIEPPSSEKVLSYKGQAVADQLKDDLSDTTRITNKAHYEAVPALEPHEYSTVPNVALDATEAEGMLALLQRRKIETEKAYKTAKDALKPNGADHTLSHKVDVQTAAGPIAVKVHYKAEQEARVFLAEDFNKENARLAKAGKPLKSEAEFFGEAYKAEAERLGESVGTVHDFAARLQRNADGYRNAVEAFKDNPLFGKVKEIGAKPVGLSNGSQQLADQAQANGLSLPKLSTITSALLGIGLTTHSAAQAADGSIEQTSEQQHKQEVEMRAGVLLASSALGYKLISKLLKTGVGKKLMLFADAVDHAAVADKVLGKVGPARLERMILDTTAEAVQMGWGVHFNSQNEKARALTELVEGLPIATAFSAPPKDSAFIGMSQQQRQAVIGYYAAKKTLGKKVAGYVKEIQDKLDDQSIPQDARDQVRKALGDSLLTLKNLALDMSGMKSAPEWPERVLSQGTANMMDFYFMTNPKHHLLNLSDSIISGSARLGPGNMARAYADMLTPEYQKTFKDANLFGSFKEDRASLGSLADKKLGRVRGVTEDLFKSDEFNANRVALAAFSQFHQVVKQSLPANYANSKNFTRDLLTGKGNIPEQVRSDAWAHMIEAEMRILGMDPLRANPNWIKRISRGSSVLSFANQPVRMARMLHEFATTNNYAALGTFLVATTALGGEAAIPMLMQVAGEHLAPEEIAKIKRTANAFSISGFLADHVPGSEYFVPNLSAKLQYEPIAPLLFGASTIAYQGARGDADKILKAGQAASQGDYSKAGQAASGAAKLTAQLIAGGIPVGQAWRIVEAAQKSVAGQGTIYNFPNNSLDPNPRPIGDPHTLKYDTVPSGRAYPWLEQLLPGQLESTYRHKAQQAERHYAKGHKNPSYFFDKQFGQGR